jgi:WD40 repeat protein
VASLLSADQQLHTVAFARDGSAIATAGQAIQIWDIATRKERVRFTEQGDNRTGGIVYASGSIHGFMAGGVREPGEGGVYLPCVFFIVFSPDGRHLITQTGVLTSCRTSIWDTRTGKLKEVIDGAVDPYAIAAGANHFPWRARGGELETVIESAVESRPVAWFAAVQRVVAHPSGKLWAGNQGRHLYLFELRQA